MTRTARRRWTRDLETLVDGIAIADSGPVLLHGYDDPAGGKWVDDVIPGKLAALDRHSGDILWISPCEVGYGRGFGAGLGPEKDAVVLGPSAQGHRIVRMALDTGELIGVSEIEPFDEALVFDDLCVCVTPSRIFGVQTSAMVELWAFQREGYRFHQICRQGEDLFVVYTDPRMSRQGVFCLDVESGEIRREVLEAKQKVIYGMASQPGSLVLLVSDVLAALPEEQWPDYGSAPGGGGLNIVAIRPDGEVGQPALWYEQAPIDEVDEYPDLHIWMDSGKLYMVHEALVDVRDALSGRDLGELTIPGLDERVAWGISQGAALVAEEERVSIFEIPV